MSESTNYKVGNEFPNWLKNKEYAWPLIRQANQQIQVLDAKKHLVFGQVCDAVVPELYKDQTEKVLITANWIDPTALDNCYYELLPHTWYCAYAGRINIETVTPTKNYNCFINRVDAGRQSWLYQLIRQGIFDQGYVSFNLDTSRNEGSSSMEIFETQFQNHLKFFDTEHQYIKNQVPYCNFDKTQQLNSIIMQSKFSIVLESYFDRNNVITTSEKIFRCLKLPRPWVMFAMKGAVEWLRKAGFDVLDDIVDHSYDKLDFWVDRQTSILQQCVALSELEFNSVLQKRLCQAAEYNQTLLETFAMTWKQDMGVCINNAYEKLKNL